MRDSKPPEPQRRPEVGLRTVLVSALLLVLPISAILMFDIDISSARDYRSDVVVRDAFDDREIPARRFHDLSPYSIWLPSDWFVWDSLRSGDLPVWERMQGAGYSPVLTVYNGVLHPARWLTVLFPRHLAPSILIVIIVWFASLGFYLLARIGLRLGTAASLTGTIAFVFSGPLLSNLHFSGGFLPLAHLPWLLLVYLLALRRPSPGRLGATAVVIASLLVSGHPTLSAGTLFAVSVVGSVMVIRHRRAKPLAVLAAGSALGVALAAFAILPPILASAETWTYKTATSQGAAFSSMSVQQWSEALQHTFIDAYEGGCCIDSPHYFYFLGFGSIVLGIIGAWSLARADERWWVLVPLALFFLIAVPGPWTEPVAGLAPLKFFKPWYLTGELAFFIAIAGAYGYQALWATPWRLLAPVLLALIIAQNGLRTSELLDPSVWKPIVAGDAVEFLRQADSRVMGLWGQVHMPNSSRVTGIEDIRLVGPLFSSRYHLWWESLDPMVIRRAYPTTRVTDILPPEALGEMGIRFILQSRLPVRGTFTSDPAEAYRDQTLSPNVTDPRYPLVARSPSLEVRTHRGRIHPRAHFVSNWETVSGLTQAVQQSAAARRRGTALVESSVPLPRTAESAEGTVSVHYPKGSRVELTIETKTGGLVVLHDSFAAGWRAKLDEKSIPMFPVNILSRGVFVPPGSHVVTMRYRPVGFLSGLVISLVTCCAIFVYAFVMRKRGMGSDRDLPATE